MMSQRMMTTSMAAMLAICSSWAMAMRQAVSACCARRGA